MQHRVGGDAVEDVIDNRSRGGKYRLCMDQFLAVGGIGFKTDFDLRVREYGWPAT